MARFKDSEFCKEVLSLIEELSCGWRREKNEKHPFVNLGKSSKLVEHYKVRQRYLVWAVDTQREISHHTQILKVWGVLEPFDVPRILKQLDMIYESYTDDKMSRCKHKHVEEYAFLAAFPLFYCSVFHWFRVERNSLIHRRRIFLQEFGCSDEMGGGFDIR